MADPSAVPTAAAAAAASADVTVAVIAGVSAVVGGIIGAIASPVGKDWVDGRAHARTVAQEDRTRRRDRLQRLSELVSLVSDPDETPSDAERGELLSKATSIKDAQLTAAVDKVLHPPERFDPGPGQDAQRRIGELLAGL